MTIAMDRAVDPRDSASPQPVHVETGVVPHHSGFPVAWESPADEQMFWTLDRMHLPDPIPPMEFEYMRDAHHQFTAAFAHYGVPLQFIPRHINYYWYFAIMPTVTDPAVLAARMKSGVQAIEQTIPRLRQLWETEWLPEILQHLEFWRGFDLAGASHSELLAHHDETVARFNRVWSLHFRQTFPVYTAMSMFDDLYQDVFGADSSLDSYRLTQGFENETIRMGRELWRLGRIALASPSLRDVIGNGDVARIVPSLERTSEGRAFLSELRTFLDVYGERGDLLGVSHTSWIEDPSTPLRYIQEYVRQPDLDVDADFAAMVTARDAALASVRASLVGYPGDVVEQFETMLVHAQQATIISEDHNRYIDFSANYQVRRVLLEMGSRLVEADILDDVSDVFLLTRAELTDAFRTNPEYDLRVTVARRNAEMRHYRSIAPPPSLGTRPDAPPPDDALNRAVGKFFGGPPPAADRPGAPILTGSAGSSGKVVGTARVITSLSEAGRLQPGDILVTSTTAPAWTPLFSSIAGVVTDTGGVLSHCAVVAREYMIPAVVGTAVATSSIADGQRIEVDGDRGLVTILT